MRTWMLLIGLLALPAVAWTAVKPVRVLAPELVGVSCTEGVVCVDRPSLQQEALQLYESSLQAVTAQLGSFERPPRVVFCSTAKCFESFGFERAAAQNIGTFGIVIGPRGWQPHYVQHEMIHHVQNERLGILQSSLATPQWFIEGMTYALSEDPRSTLAEPWESYRSRFNAWYSSVDKERLWIEAARL